jgi:hypothetical protein
MAIHTQSYELQLSDALARSAGTTTAPPTGLAPERALVEVFHVKH